MLQEPDRKSPEFVGESVSSARVDNALRAARKRRAGRARRRPLGRPGLAASRQAKVSRWAQAMSSGTKRLQEQGGGDAAGHRRVGRHWRGRRRRSSASRHRRPTAASATSGSSTSLAAAARARRRDRRRLANNAGKVGPERDPRGAGQGREIDDQLGLCPRPPRVSASARISRPSASVLSISTDRPLRDLTMSPGR